MVSAQKNIRIKVGDVFKCSGILHLCAGKRVLEEETNHIQVGNAVFKITRVYKQDKMYTVQFLIDKTRGASIKARVAEKFIRGSCIKIPRIKAELLYKN